MFTLRSSASGGLRPFSEEKGLKNLKRLFNSLAMAQFVAQEHLGSEPQSTAPSFHRTLIVHREALKVFLEFLEPFSSEKGSKPRGSDWSEATTHGEAVQTR